MDQERLAHQFKPMQQASGQKEPSVVTAIQAIDQYGNVVAQAQNPRL